MDQLQLVTITHCLLLLISDIIPLMYFLGFIVTDSCLSPLLSGMAIFDTMRHIRPDVSTVCVGLAAR